MSLTGINPSMKALAVVVSVLLLAFVFDPVTPLLFLLFVIGVTWGTGKVSVKKWLLYFSPFLLIAVAYVWTTVLFVHNPEGHKGNVLWSWGWFEVTQEAVYTGLSLGLRVLCFAALSLMFILTTDPTRFMFSLMQQCQLSPKIAYGILAGYRFLPLFKEELRILQNAHRIRGVGRSGGLRERLLTLRRYAIPLLASAIRKAHRVAMAMESKGFTGTRDRTTYYRMKVSVKDWLFVAIMILAFLLSALLSSQLGHLQWY